MRAAGLATRFAARLQSQAAERRREGGGAAADDPSLEPAEASSLGRLHLAWGEAREALLARGGAAGALLLQLDADIERLCCEGEAAQLAPVQPPLA